MNLNHSELERLAYIAGNYDLANHAAAQEELEALQKSFEDQIKAAKAKAFKEGKKEGRIKSTGREMDKMVDAQRKEIARLKTQINSLIGRLDEVDNWLMSAECKTLKGRSEFEQRLRSALNAMTRY